MKTSGSTSLVLNFTKSTKTPTYIRAIRKMPLLNPFMLNDQVYRKSHRRKLN